MDNAEQGATQTITAFDGYMSHLESLLPYTLKPTLEAHLSRFKDAQRKDHKERLARRPSIYTKEALLE